MDEFVIWIRLFPAVENWEFTVLEWSTGNCMLSNCPMGNPNMAWTLQQYMDTAKAKTRELGYTWFPAE